MSFIPESMFRNNQDFHGVPDFMMRRSTSYSGMDRAEEFHPDDDASDDGSQLMLGDKKRRLNPDQVKALEKSFDSGSKLEPERKMQLARTLGLQPRQIAIWFQNRRARWKNKQLERDYDVLKRQFEAIKADNDDLKSRNKNLQVQLSNMRSRDFNTTAINLNKDNEGSNWSGSDNSCDREVNLNAINYQGASSMNTTAHATTTTLTHLIRGSSGQDHPQKNIGNNSQTPVSNDHGFGNVMFGGIEENPEFWLWPEQDHLQ